MCLNLIQVLYKAIKLIKMIVSIKSRDHKRGTKDRGKVSMQSRMGLMSLSFLHVKSGAIFLFEKYIILF
jgi:hypothetical protein